MWFFLGDKFNGSILFDLRGQHEVLEVNVITNIRTIINYPCRPLLVHFYKHLIMSYVGYKSHQHHHTYYNQQLYWRSHPKWRQTVSGITIVNLNATGSLQLEHVHARVWIWRTIITSMYYNRLWCCVQYWLGCTCYIKAMVLVWRRRKRNIGASIAVSWASASSCAQNTLLATGTTSSATCGTSTAIQHIHGFGGSRESSPEWCPTGFRVDSTLEVRARQY